jgi:hypothetical protein
MDQDGGERKERVIHMRVEPSLDSELKERASRLGVSVSNLVRNILNHAFGLAEDVIKDSAQVARSARGEPDPGSHHDVSQSRSTADQARPARPLGWQRFTLSVNALCERCNTILPKGSEAAIAVLDGPGPRSILCPACAGEPKDVSEPSDPRDV